VALRADEIRAAAKRLPPDSGARITALNYVADAESYTRRAVEMLARAEAALATRESPNIGTIRVIRG
jgi:hypothetical protein